MWRDKVYLYHNYTRKNEIRWDKKISVWYDAQNHLLNRHKNFMEVIKYDKDVVNTWLYCKTKHNKLFIISWKKKKKKKVIQKKKKLELPECLEKVSGAGMACHPFVWTTNNLWALESPRDISTGGMTEKSADWSTKKTVIIIVIMMS